MSPRVNVNTSTVGSTRFPKWRSRIASFLLFVGMGVLAQAAEAQTGSLTGRVTNAASGAAVDGVSILFPQLDIGTLGRADGRYQLSNIPVGTYEVSVEP
ncbi:MAG: carboxypeptidase regulatory-like domain-containing protein, partial [Longimicrobiales bacterium]